MGWGSIRLCSLVLCYVLSFILGFPIDSAFVTLCCCGFLSFVFIDHY
jgi:hypothetical protein